MSSPQTLPKVLSPGEVKALMAVPNMRSPTGLRNRCMLELMHGCGLRVSETCGLHVRDVRWREGKIHLRAEITKGNREAWVSVPDRILALLERWVHVRRRYAAGQPHLFTTLQGAPVRRKYVWEAIQRYARRAGIAHAAPHILRHTFATDLLAEGFNIREVQELLRHADLRTTQIYTHIHDDELHRKVRERVAA
jgi:integrase/recombinase XerD